MRPAVRRPRAAADRRDDARGERRYREDVHDRGARRALRGRGHAARPAPARHVHAHGDRRAARPRARAAGRGRAGALSRARGRAAAPTRSRRCSPPARRRSCALAAHGSRMRSPTSTRRPSPRPTGSARRCSPGSAWSATSSPGPSSSRTSTTCSRRWSTTSTCGASTSSGCRSSSAGRRCRSPARPSRTRRLRWCRCGAPEESIAAMRVRLALRVRDELEARKRRSEVMTYDDLLTRLKGTLEGPSGEAAARRLREQYGVVLVDEFQDTDPVQWDILRLAFGGGRGDAGPHRRPETGDLRVPRSRRLRVSRRRSGGGGAGHARRQLAQRPGADRRLRRAVRQRAARPRGDRVPARAGRRGAPRARARGCAGRAPLRLRLVPRSRRWRRRRAATRARPRRASTSPPTSPAASSTCCPRRPRSAWRTAGESRSGRATSPCSSAPTAPARSCATRSAAAGIPAVIGGAGSVFGTAPANDWLVAPGGARAPRLLAPRALGRR